MGGFCCSVEMRLIEAFAAKEGIEPQNVKVDHPATSTKCKIVLLGVAFFSGGLFVVGSVLTAIGVIPAGGGAAMMSVGGIIFLIDLGIILLLDRRHQALVDAVNSHLISNPECSLKEGVFNNYMTIPIKDSSLFAYVLKRDNQLIIRYCNRAFLESHHGTETVE